jgi:hypothetical protein
MSDDDTRSKVGRGSVRLEDDRVCVFERNGVYQARIRKEKGGYLLGIDNSSSNNLVEPTPAASNGSNKGEAGPAAMHLVHDIPFGIRSDHMRLPTIAVSTGDPAGIGPEIALKAALDPGVSTLCRPLLVGDLAVVQVHARSAGLSSELNIIAKPGEAKWSTGAVNMLDASDDSRTPLKVGTVDAAYGRASLASARRAIQVALAGEVAAICDNARCRER